MSQPLPEPWFVEDSRVNAIIAWIIAAALAVAAVSNLLSVLLVDAFLAAVAALAAVVPAIASRTWTRTVPWPLLVFAAVPFLVRAVEPSAFSLVVIGAGIAALGMLLVSALQLTTSVRMTPRFAIAFVVLLTLAFAGFWAVGSAASARYLGTGFVETNTELMSIFTAALVGGLVGGGIFRWYFRWQLRHESPRAREVETT
ncbi:hypothetical protein VB773_21280 [Haloarculaceae archaeon H-GB2-1]|nr:hypothetical protein [Haloarculaceae archaeon H-GB1-1]MEA5389350.1 hypothetical protein [Haloarculaceae archaeon H-GB11]MEA5409851.1 hypothetical protein [Haloarculaceae archaeon H-GB2-1]